MTVAARPAVQPTSTGTAYEQDFYTWTQEQAARLRAGDWPALDRENLAEEIASLGRSEFNSLVSAWRIVLLHMLKYDNQPSRRTRSWVLSIAAQRVEAMDVLKDNPGLKHRLDEARERAYHRARIEASKETGISLKRFPDRCPYTIEEMLSREFDADPNGSQT